MTTTHREGLVGMAERLVRVRARLFDARTHAVQPRVDDVLEEMRLSRWIGYYLTAGRGPTILAALNAGVTLLDIAAALGRPPMDVRAEYLQWIDQQVAHFHKTGRPGMTSAEAADARRLADIPPGGVS